MSKPDKIRKIYDTLDDILDDDGEPVDPDLERDEEWHERYHIVENEEERDL